MHILRIELVFFQLKTVCTCDSVASKYLKVYSRLFDTRIIIQLNNDELPLNPTKKKLRNVLFRGSPCIAQFLF